MREIGREEAPSCECEEQNDELITSSREKMPNEELIFELSDFFKIFGDSTRLNILFVLDSNPMCVCDIAGALNMTKSAVSHQLKILRQNSLVSFRKIGKNVIYSLADEHVRDIIEKALEHIKE